jgi:hypothetical protein
LLNNETELNECVYCGRKVSLLLPVTADDIQRVYPPKVLAYRYACQDCLPKIRAMSRLVPEYTLNDALRYLSTRVPILIIGLSVIGVAVTVLFRGTTIVRLSPTAFVGVLAVFTGLQMMWVRSQDRYGATHDLRWSLNSRPVVRGVAILVAGIIVFLLSVYLHF